MFDNLIFTVDGALEQMRAAEHCARAARLVAFYARGDSKRARHWSQVWIQHLARAHYWGMYILAMEVDNA